MNRMYSTELNNFGKTVKSVLLTESKTIQRTVCKSTKIDVTYGRKAVRRHVSLKSICCYYLQIGVIFCRHPTLKFSRFFFHLKELKCVEDGTYCCHSLFLCKSVFFISLSPLSSFGYHKFNIFRFSITRDLFNTYASNYRQFYGRRMVFSSEFSFWISLSSFSPNFISSLTILFH